MCPQLRFDSHARRPPRFDSHARRGPCQPRVLSTSTGAFCLCSCSDGQLRQRGGLRRSRADPSRTLARASFSSHAVRSTHLFSTLRHDHASRASVRSLLGVHTLALDAPALDATTSAVISTRSLDVPVLDATTRSTCPCSTRQRARYAHSLGVLDAQRPCNTRRHDGFATHYVLVAHNGFAVRGA